MPAKLIDDRSHFEYDVGDEVTTIGRMPENDVALAGNAVSRYHAKIRREGEKWWLEDLGSRNGTYVNGRKLEAPAELKDGDKVVLGITRVLPEGEYGFTFKTEAAEGGLVRKVKTTLRAVVGRKPIETGRTELERGGKVLVARLSGIFSKPEVDALRETLVKELAAGARTMALDVSGVSSMNSYGLAVLVDIAAKLSEESRELRVFGQAGSVKKLLLMPGEKNPIRLCASREEALQDG